MSNNISVKVSPPQNIRIGVNGMVASIAGVDPINVTGQSHVVISVDKATASNLGVMTLTDAGNAAPIQELVAGSGIGIVQNPGKSFTINAIVPPQQQTDWNEASTASPAFLKNKPTSLSQFNNDPGFINLSQSVAAAPVQSVNSKTGNVVLTYTDVGALPGNTAVPEKTSDLTNDGDGSGGGQFVDYASLSNELVDYLKLSGGTITGNLTVDMALNVGPSGSARVPTPAAADASTQVATTEWVQSLISATGATRYVWRYGGVFDGTPPAAGNLKISISKVTIAISTTDAGGIVRNLSALQKGDTITLTDDPVQGGTSEYARYDITGSITDNGSWVSIPVTLVSESNPPVAQGQNVRVSFFMNAMSSAIDGVSAGYGLTGGGVSGIVSLAIDTAVVAELSDLPTKVSQLTNDSGYITAAGAPVQSVNTKTGAVVLAAADVGAVAPGDNTSDLNNDGDGSGGGPFVDYAALSHELGDYLPLAGGTMTGAISWDSGPRITDHNANILAFDTAGVERVRIATFGVQLPDNYQSHTGAVYGFFSQINTSATNTATYQVLAAGNAKSQFNGQILVTALSDSQPALANRSDPTSGISITDVTQFITQGVETARFDSLGHLCVGTKSTPLGTQKGIQLFGDQQPEIRFNNTATGEGPTTGTGLFLSNKNFSIRNRENGGQVYVYTNNTVAFAVSQTSVTSNVQYLSPMGTAVSPGYAFNGETDTGTFSPGANMWAVSTAGVKRFEIDATGDSYFGGWVGILTPDDATAALDVNGESIRIRQSVTPANATATGEAGEIMWDANYLYVCVATNTWKRVALSSW